MLRALEIRDFVIVENASLELGSGFTVLTGETGAGKSILVDALELLVGARADAGLVRAGAGRAELSAEFEVESRKDLLSWLEANEFAGDAGALLLRRTIDASGRSRCFVNGHAATAAQLKEAGELLVDIHGQARCRAGSAATASAAAAPRAGRRGTRRGSGAPPRASAPRACRG